MTRQRSIRAGSELGRLVFGLGRSGPGRVKHVARCDAATSWPWALIGLRPQHGSHRVAHDGPALLIHGPKAGSMVDRAHRHFSSARLMCTGCRVALLTLPLSPLFLPRRAPAGDVLTGELPQRLRHPIEVGKKPPCATMTAMVESGQRMVHPKSLVTANDGSSTTARAGMARVQRHWPALWCAWVSQCSSGHVG